MKAQDSQLNAQNQQASTQMASKLKQEEIQIQLQADIARMKAENDFKMQFGQTTFKQQMELQKLKNEGADTVAEINSGGKVNVQDAANKGKVVASQIESATQIAKAHIVHHSDHTKIDHETDAQKELADQAHQHNIAEIKATPKPKPSAK